MGEKEGSGVNNRRFRCGRCARRDDAQTSVSASDASKAEMRAPILRALVSEGTFVAMAFERSSRPSPVNRYQDKQRGPEARQDL